MAVFDVAADLTTREVHCVEIHVRRVGPDGVEQRARVP